MAFRDRSDAGRALAERVAPMRLARPVVLGVARGGVAVAAEVARAIGAELDVLAVRKLGAPAFPEYAVGAIAEGGAAWVDADAAREVGLDADGVSRLAAREAVELARRVRVYRGGRPPPDLAGCTAVVVDDGVATGATARAACRAARAMGADRVVLATPVIAAAVEEALRDELDDVVAVERPEDLGAVGAWYERFDQLGDADVVALLRRGAAGAGGGEVRG
jgi:putative phosphoribosyl transferase